MHRCVYVRNHFRLLLGALPKARIDSSGRERQTRVATNACPSFPLSFSVKRSCVEGFAEGLASLLGSFLWLGG